MKIPITSRSVEEGVQQHLVINALLKNFVFSSSSSIAALEDIVGVDVNKMISYLVHHNEPALPSTLLKRFPVEVLNHV